MTPERINEIRERCEAATPGPLQPYYLIKNSDGTYQGKKEMMRTLDQMIDDTIKHGACEAFWGVQKLGDTGSPERVSVCLTMNGPTSEANAHFIAHAPTDIPELLDYVARLEEENAELRTTARRLDYERNSR